MRDECQKFDECSAPLCPNNPDSLGDIWFPDEEICTKHSPNWVKVQRKTAERASGGYFTSDMLKQNCRINQGITGLDPDEPEPAQLKAWLKKHPSKKELSETEKAEIRERFNGHRPIKKQASHRENTPQKHARTGQI